MQKPEPLKSRLEKDENWIMKLGTQISEAYAQFGDMYRMLLEQQQQITNLKKKVEDLELAVHKNSTKE